MLVHVNISAYRDEQEHSWKPWYNQRKYFHANCMRNIQSFNDNMCTISNSTTFSKVNKYSTQYSITYIKPTRCNSGQYLFLTTAGTLYLFRALLAPIIKRTMNCRCSHWCLS